MSKHFDDFDFYDDEIPEGMVVCDRCNGDGEVDCRCGGDQCYCGDSEVPCPVCHGEQYITKERWEKRAAAHREIMEALWGKPQAGANDEGTATGKAESERPANSNTNPLQRLTAPADRTTAAVDPASPRPDGAGTFSGGEG